MQNHTSGDAGQEKSFSVEIIANMVVDFLKLSSLSILTGCLLGFASALLMKHIDMRETPIREFTILMMFAYGSYLSAEALALSGIISMFSCGLCMAHYSFWNMSRQAQRGTELAVNSMASISQSFLYIYMGMTAFSLS